jgi:hypothetical protein
MGGIAKVYNFRPNAIIFRCGAKVFISPAAWGGVQVMVVTVAIDDFSDIWNKQKISERNEHHGYNNKARFCKNGTGYPHFLE